MGALAKKPLEQRPAFLSRGELLPKGLRARDGISGRTAFNHACYLEKKFKDLQTLASVAVWK